MSKTKSPSLRSVKKAAPTLRTASPSPVAAAVSEVAVRVVASGPRETAQRVLPAHTAYLAETLPFGRLTRVMDVGANPVNRPAYADLVDAGHVEVHGFEPGDEAFQRLDKTKGPHEVYHPHAVGSGGQAMFHVCENGSFSSLFAPDRSQIDALGHWHKSMTVNEKIPVKTVALDKIKDLPRPDMLKMDTQGRNWTF